MALAEVHRRVLGGPEEGAGHIAVDHKAVGVGRTAVVAGRRIAAVAGRESPRAGRRKGPS